MEVISQASAKLNYGNGIMPCMVTKFSTGHKYTKWSNGTEFFHKKNGTAMNEKTGLKLIVKMRELARV